MKTLKTTLGYLRHVRAVGRLEDVLVDPGEGDEPLVVGRQVIHELARSVDAHPPGVIHAPRPERLPSLRPVSSAAGCCGRRTAAGRRTCDRARRPGRASGRRGGRRASAGAGSWSNSASDSRQTAFPPSKPAPERGVVSQSVNGPA